MRMRTATDLGAFIRERRTKLGMDQVALAEKAGTSRKWLIEVEQGKPRAEIGLILRTLKTLSAHELNGTSAVFSYVFNEPKDIPRRYMKLSSPTLEDTFIVRQQAPKEGLNPFVAMRNRTKRHRKRQRICVGVAEPTLAIDERQSRALISHSSDFTAIQESYELIGHGRFFKELRTLLMSVEPALSFEVALASESIC